MLVGFCVSACRVSSLFCFITWFGLVWIGWLLIWCYFNRSASFIRKSCWHIQYLNVYIYISVGGRPFSTYARRGQGRGLAHSVRQWISLWNDVTKMRTGGRGCQKSWNFCVRIKWITPSYALDNLDNIMMFIVRLSMFLSVSNITYTKLTTYNSIWSFQF